MPIVTQVNRESVAYRFGVESAERGEPFAPEAWFIQRQQQIDFSRGYESIAGVTLTTSHFTGSDLPKPIIVPNRKASASEYIRRTDGYAADRILKLAERRDRRIERMLEMSRAFLGEDSSDIIFMAA